LLLQKYKEEIVKVIPFGSLVKDKVTGFEGFIVCRIEHMNNCVRYGVQPGVDEEDQLPECKFIEGPNLKVVSPPREDLPLAIKTPDTFKLGAKVKDRLTGFTGIAVLRVKSMYSGDRYGVQPPVNKKGEIPEVKTFDEEDLEQVPPPKKKRKRPESPPNGPHDHNTAIAR
jgi:hypothetical protein